MKRQLVAKTLLFDAEGQALVLQRARNDDNRPGGVDLPGGGVEDDKDKGSPVAAAVREAKEEAGQQLEPSALKLAYLSTMYKAETDTIIFRHLYIGRLVVQDIRLSEEHSDFRLVAINQLPVLFRETAWLPGIQFVLERNMFAELYSQ